jgi:hypothetical protein
MLTSKDKLLVSMSSSLIAFVLLLSLNISLITAFIGCVIFFFALIIGLKSKDTPTTKRDYERDIEKEEYLREKARIKARQDYGEKERPKYDNPFGNSSALFGFSSKKRK